MNLQAPDFILMGLQNRVVRLHDLLAHGAITLGIVGDGVKMTEVLPFVDKMHQHCLRGEQVYLVLPFSPQQLQELKKRYAIQYELLCDPFHHVAKLYGALAKPKFFRIAMDGRIFLPHLTQKSNAVKHQMGAADG